MATPDPATGKDRVAWITLGLTTLMIIVGWVAQQAVTASQLADVKQSVTDLKSDVKDMRKDQQTMSTAITQIATRQTDASLGNKK